MTIDPLSEASEIVQAVDMSAANEMLGRVTHDHYLAMLAAGFDRDHAFWLAQDVHGLLIERMYEGKE